jgi:hypothetical protein
MDERRQMIPIAGLIATCAVAAYMVVQLGAQAASTLGDFRNAVAAEVRDAQGQVLLRGNFAVVEEEDDEVERRAVLEPTGVDADAAGEVEVEFSKTGASEQEIELSARNVQPGAVLTLVIDGTEVTTVTAGPNGVAEID